MDFGALQCTPRQPRCGACPFRDSCLAQASGTVMQRPVKQGRTAVRDRWFNYLHLTCGGRTFLRRREGHDIWQGLYEFPMIESDRALDFRGLAATEAFSEWLGDAEWHLVCSVVMPRHPLSHQTIHAVFHRIEVGAFAGAGRCVSVPEEGLGEYAVPRLTDLYLSR